MVQRSLCVRVNNKGWIRGRGESADKPITLTIIENEQWRQLVINVSLQLKNRLASTFDAFHEILIGK